MNQLETPNRRVGNCSTNIRSSSAGDQSDGRQDNLHDYTDNHNSYDDYSTSFEDERRGHNREEDFVIPATQKV